MNSSFLAPIGMPTLLRNGQAIPMIKPEDARTKKRNKAQRAARKARRKGEAR